MKQYIKEYTKYLEDILLNNKKVTNEEINNIVTKISFIQHERLIHLIVTFFFALFTIIFFVLTLKDIIFAIPFAIFMIVLFFYILHYYFLENSTQNLYKLYDDIYTKKYKK